MSSAKIVIAFDLFGTLLSTESIAEALSVHFGHQKAKVIAANWRRYQLEYTWRINSMGEEASLGSHLNEILRSLTMELRSVQNFQRDHSGGVEACRH
jgi:2-haloacid dehalogenase